MRPPRAIGLIRISSPQPVDEQEAGIQRIAERRKATLVQIIVDIAPGDSPLEDRRGPSDAIEAIRKGEASVVIATEPSRITRSFSELARFAERVRRAGGEVVTEIDLGVGR